MNALRGVGVAVSLFAFGCGSKPAPPAPPKAAAPSPPAEGRWVIEGSRARLQFGEGSIWELEVATDTFSSDVRVSAKRPFSIGTSSFTDVGTSKLVKVSVVPWLGALDIDPLRNGKRSLAAWKKKSPPTEKKVDRTREPIDWRIPMETWLSPDGSKRWKGTLPPFAVHPAAMFGVLKGEAPLVFEGDDSAPERPDTIFINFQFGKPLDPLVGTGTTLRDVDWIAVSTWRPTGKMKKCGGYGRTPGVAGNTVVNVSLDEVEVRVIDRRTAEVLGTRVFPPENTCPGAVTGTDAAVGANTDVIVAWLEKQLVAGKVTAAK